MKNIILIGALLLNTFAFSQNNEEAKKDKINLYVAGGMSIGHVDPNDQFINNFNKASFPSIEIGLCKQNISWGAVFGMENVFASSSTRGFYELKTSISYPVTSSSSVYGLFGSGAYFENSFNPFIEYGAGYTYMPDKLGYFVQYSNWARSNYVSVGLTYSF